MTYTNMELRICPELIREEKYGTPYLSGINPEFFRAAGQNSPCLPQIKASDNSGYVFPFNSSDKENPRIAGYPFNDSSTSYPKFRIVPPTPHRVPLGRRFLFIYIFTSNTILNYAGFFFLLFLMVLRPDLFPWIGVQGFLNGKKVTIVEIVLKYLTDIPLPNHEVWVHPTMHEQC